MVTTVTLIKGRDRGRKLASFRNSAAAQLYAEGLADRFGAEVIRDRTLNCYVVNASNYFDSIDSRHTP